LALFQLFLFKPANAQTTATTSNYSLVDNLNPVTPTMYQFTKYTDLPVSEYTGVPNISIPLYEIDEDGVKIPLGLTYHAGGIHVNEAASWVGLGWDMSVGSIVQTVNDQDDLAANMTHIQSDYVNSGTPQVNYRYNYCASEGGETYCITGCNGPVAVDAVTTADGIQTYTNMWAPFGGNYLQNYENYFWNHNYDKVDSEPDIFTANFLGHSFKFMIQWGTGSSWTWNPQKIVVLDKKGYQVTWTGSGWTVVAPSGEEYVFALKDQIQTTSNSGTLASAVGPSSALQPSSNVYMLTQIITKNKKTITFNYTQTAVQNCYPNFSQKGILATLETSWTNPNLDAINNFCMSVNVGSPAVGVTSINTTSYSQEPYTYLSSIIFPKGTVNFNLSARNDITGGLKLDSLSVNTTQEIKSYYFNYSYFDATSVGGNTFTITNTAGVGNTGLYRLELLSVQDNGGATHTFTYNTIPLPARNSFATDCWGYYNGTTANTSFIPNATQFNKTGWLTNSDNHSANLTYAQAGILQQIKYPTGGSANFTYALNQFNTYWVPDYSSSTNTISSGDGLRIQSIIWNDINGSQLKQTNYTYNGGMASIPVNFFRSYSYGTVGAGNIGANGAPNWNSYNINETNTTGSFTANPFSSFNGVGYTQVIKTDVDNNGNPNGKTVSIYYNQPDLVYNSITVAQQLDPTLPAYKNPADTANNGSLKSVSYYDNSNNLLKQISNRYTNIMSPVYYGARVMGYGAWVTYNGVGGINGYQQVALPQNMVCFYPIFDFESLLATSTETDYFGADNLTFATTNTYDQYNQLSSTVKSNASSVAESTAITYPYDYPSNTMLTTMTSQNRLSDIVTVTKGSSSDGSASYLARTYRQLGNLIVANNDMLETHYNGIPDSTTYDQYDPLNGNIWQYSKNHLPFSLLWDYNKEYVTAEVKNALITNVAYTSFEADGNGRWTFSGTPITDSQAPTGSKAYSLTTGNISCSGLDATQTYIISYWSKNGAQTVSGSSSVKQGYTFNGYTYFEHTVITPASGAITVSGTAEIDELRLYPNTAQMTSYTYTPLVGMSSESSAGGKISYYQYDSSQRLINIVDQYGNIVKHMSYHYQGQ